MRYLHPSALPALGLILVLACAPAEETAEPPAPTAGSPTTEAPPAEPVTRATMARIVEAMRVALPLALDPERFADPAHRESIRAALANLAASASALEAHADEHDPETGFLSRSLAADATDLAARFDAGRHDEASFLIKMLVDNCFVCHSRTPDVERRELGELLLATLDADALEPRELARLQAATRQFDAALDTWEEMFRAPTPGPAELARQGLLVDYLVVAIRVKDDFERPRAALEALAARDDAPAFLQVELRAWAKALAELGERPPPASDLDAARALIDAPAGRDRVHGAIRVVHDVAASAHLHRLLLRWRTSGATANGAPANEQRAEAYYLLGLVESRIRQSSWILQAEHYLETAIRTAPGGPFAQAAYDLLEQEITADLGGSTGEPLSDEVQRRLADLAELAAGATASP